MRAEAPPASATATSWVQRICRKVERGLWTRFLQAHREGRLFLATKNTKNTKNTGQTGGTR
jgi:hypothetical protein